jgi:hypothetical protein
MVDAIEEVAGEKKVVVVDQETPSYESPEMSPSKYELPNVGNMEVAEKEPSFTRKQQQYGGGKNMMMWYILIGGVCVAIVGYALWHYMKKKNANKEEQKK